MIRQRVSTLLTTASLLLSLTAVSVALPVSTLAATPNWTGSLETLPPVVAPGAIAGYRATITNPGPSNVSQLSVTAVFSQPYNATTLPATGPNPVYVKLLLNGVELAGACGTAPLTRPVSCTVGALNTGSTAVLVVAYQTTGTLAAGVTVRWTSSGLGSGGGDNSHGDVLNQFFDTNSETPELPPTGFNSTANFDGAFTTEAGESFATSGVLSSTNQFTTRFTSSDAFVPVSVQDDTTTSAGLAPCPATKTCYGLPGHDAIILNINEGAPLAGLTPFTIMVYKSAVPKNANVNNVTVVHYFTAPHDPELELISNDCPAIPTGTCRSVSWNGKTGVWTIVVYLEDNGVIKFH